jgi:hypothetical protein
LTVIIFTQTIKKITETAAITPPHWSKVISFIPLISTADINHFQICHSNGKKSRSPQQKKALMPTDTVKQYRLHEFYRSLKYRKLSSSTRKFGLSLYIVQASLTLLTIDVISRTIPKGYYQNNALITAIITSTDYLAILVILPLLVVMFRLLLLFDNSID